MIPTKFNRRPDLEAAISVAHREKDLGYMGTHDRHKFACFTTMMNELDCLLDQSETTKQGKYHLNNWLNSLSIDRLNIQLKQREAQDYLNGLIDYLGELKTQTGYRYIYQRNKSVNDELFEYSRTIGNSIASKEMTAFALGRHKHSFIDRGYGLVIRGHYREYLFIGNDSTFTGSELKTRTVVFMSEEVSNNSENFTQISASEWVEAIVVITTRNPRILDTSNLYAIYANKINVLMRNNEELIKNFNEIDRGVFENGIQSLKDRMRVIESEYISQCDIKFSGDAYSRQLKLLAYKASDLIQHLGYLGPIASTIPGGSQFIVEMKLQLRGIAYSCKVKSMTNKGLSDIEPKLHKTLTHINKNRSLYGEKQKGDIHSEEVLASILKTILEVTFDDVFHVTQEEKNGAGFTDVAIKKGTSDLALIECKLIKANDKAGKIDKKIAEGLDQVYGRYSNRIFCQYNFEPLLYLVLFVVDPDWKTIRKKIEQVVELYCKDNSINHELESVLNGGAINISFLEKQGVSSRTIKIQIIVVGLEDVIDRRATALKGFNKRGG